MENEFSQQFEQAVRNIAQQLYGAMYKQVKKDMQQEGKDYQGGYTDGYRAGKDTILHNFPAWKEAQKDDYAMEQVVALAGEFGTKVLHRGMLIKAGWKYISVKSLKLLPKEVEDGAD